MVSVLICHEQMVEALKRVDELLEHFVNDLSDRRFVAHVANDLAHWVTHVVCSVGALDPSSRLQGRKRLQGHRKRLWGIRLLPCIAELAAQHTAGFRSEERRVGKECRSRWSGDQ